MPTQTTIAAEIRQEIFARADAFSRNFYDPDEWFSPGVEEINSAVEGAMRARLLAYPL